MDKYEKAYEIISHYLDVVSKRTGCSRFEILASIRSKELKNARFAVMYLCDKYHKKEVTNGSMAQFFYLHHSTINHAIATAKNDIEHGVFYHWIGEVKKRNRITVSEDGKRIFCIGGEVSEREFREAFAAYLNATNH